MRINRAIAPGLAITLSTMSSIFPAHGAATPTPIHVLDTTYSTSVFRAWREKIPGSPGSGTRRVTLSRNQVSTTPVQDEIPFQVVDNGTFQAAAGADLFHVTASGSTKQWLALASAHSEMDFSPLADGSASLTLDFGRFYDFGFVGGHVRLLDRTSNTELFNYEWKQLSNGNIPWDDSRGKAKVTLNEYLDNDHTYYLSMFASMSSNHDSELVKIGLTGLQVAAVPEAPTLALMLAGLLMTGIAAMRRNSARGSEPH